MKSVGNIPIIEASGTPYEIGLAHGSGAKDRIAISIDTYRTMFYDYSQITWDRALKLVTAYEDNIRDYNPDYLEEMKGVADGAGVKFEEILALNSRSGLVFQGTAITEGCTSVSITPERAENGDTLIGQNWDWKMAIRPALILLKIHQKNGKPDIRMVTEAGIIGKIGCNSAGIGVCLNALGSDEAPKGLPLHLALRGVLDATNLNDAVTAVVRMKLDCCANFLIAHRDGESLDVEVGGDDFDVLYPKDSIMVHTNHFISMRLPPHPYVDTVKKLHPNSFSRLGRMDKLMRAIQGPIGVKDIKRAFTDHACHPFAICRHEGDEIGGLASSTVFSIIMNLTHGDMFVCPQHPCNTPFEEILR